MASAMPPTANSIQTPQGTNTPQGMPGRKSKPLLFFALMLIKLNLERLLRVRNPLDGGHGNLELKIANSADSDSRHGSEPFEHPKSPLFHSQIFSQQSTQGARLLDLP
jgi:hypothetical protein